MKLSSAVVLLASITPLVCLGQGLPGIESLFGEDVAARVLSREGQVSLYKDNTYWAIDTGDTVRVRQVLSSLLSNAVKYTVRGRIEARVALARKNEGGAARHLRRDRFRAARAFRREGDRDPLRVRRR